METSSNIAEVLNTLRNRVLTHPYYNEDGTRSKWSCEQETPTHEAYWPDQNPNDLVAEVTDWRDNSPE